MIGVKIVSKGYRFFEFLREYVINMINFKKKKTEIINKKTAGII